MNTLRAAQAPPVPAQRLGIIRKKATKMVSQPAGQAPSIAAVEDRLRSNVIGQPEAITELVQCWSRFRAGLGPVNRPQGVFLLIGPTGSGKTHIARQFAEAVTGSPDAPLRIDCGELTQGHEVAKLIGAPPGYLGHRETPALLSKTNLAKQATADCPLAIVLFDEIDKAHPRVWDLLLGIMDTGRLTLGDNTTVDFVPTIILLTGNTGSRQIADGLTPRWGLGASAAPETAVMSAPAIQRSAESAARRILRPEAFNRIDKVLVFNQLSQGDLKPILGLELAALRERLAASREIRLTWTGPVADMLIADGYDSRYGARHLKRSVTRNLEVPLANAILSGAVPDSTNVVACVRDGAIVFQVGPEAGPDA